MRHFANLGLLGLMLLGIAMAADTSWGWAVAALPLVVWGMSFLALVHKSLWAALVFWGAVAFVQWQVALVALAAWGILWVVKGWKGLPPHVRRGRGANARRARELDEFMMTYRYDYRFEEVLKDD